MTPVKLNLLTAKTSVFSSLWCVEREGLNSCCQAG